MRSQKDKRLRDQILTSGKYWAEAGFGENARDFIAFVALNFNASFFHGTAAAAGFLHLFGEFFFFREADADEIFYHGNGFATAMGGLAEDIDAAAVFGASGALAGGFVSGSFRWCGGQSFAAEASEWVLAKRFTAINRNALIAAHASIYLGGGESALKNWV
jgi:hypothetical protein